MSHQDDSPAIQELQRKIALLRAHLLFYTIFQLDIPKMIEAFVDIDAQLQRLIVEEGLEIEELKQVKHVIPF